MKKAIASGNIKISELYNMRSSGERRAVFEEFTSPELAQKINANFEKAMISKQKTALKEWAKKTFADKDKGGSAYKDVIEKINKLEEKGVLNESNSRAFLEDLVADKMGVRVSPTEVKTIAEKARALEKEFQKETPDGIPTVEYWKARKEMDNYLQSLVPSSRLKVATSIIRRGNMLGSTKSPLTNIISNTVNGLVQAMEKRMASNTYKGLNSKFAMDYVKKTHKIYQESGFDISRMENYTQGQVRLGEKITSSQGKGKVRAVGRWYEDVVFKQLMGAPDVVSSSIAWADTANLASSKIARGNKAKALEIFKDAARIEPKTVNGEIVRAQAIADARYATYTQKGGYSDLALGIRNVLNKATGDFRLGDQVMPFVKTPANVVEAGVDTAGLGALKAILKVPEAIKELKLGNKQPMQDVVRLSTRTGLGFTLAVILAEATDPEDFIGEYEALTPKARAMVRAKGGAYNAVKWGDKWVNTDYFGPLAAAYVGYMYSKKYGDTLPQKIAAYGRGVGSQVTKIPGLRDFSDLVAGINREVKEKDAMKTGERLTNEGLAYVRSSVIPAIVNDFAKATDPVQRDTGRSQIAKAQASIPFIRGFLPERINQVTGETFKSQGFWQTLLFGARLKDASESPILDELAYLYDNQSAPAISDVTRYSKRMRELEDQISKEEFRKAEKFYAKAFSNDIMDLINESYYQDMDIEDRKKEWNAIRRDAIDDTLYEFGYETPE
jgi:hypothetical protein